MSNGVSLYVHGPVPRTAKCLDVIVRPMQIEVFDREAPTCFSGFRTLAYRDGAWYLRVKLIKSGS